MTNVFDLTYSSKPSQQPSTLITFELGLHVIYGESHSGKSDIIRQLLGNKSNSNWRIESNVEPSIVQVIFQNPDNQIIQHSVEKELAFSFECLSVDSNTIQNKVKRAKEALLFNSDNHQHPATLSGGEKEILNVVTGFSTKSSVVCLDDSLSFLSSSNKDSLVKYIKTQAADHQQTVLWFTSDINDIKYGETTWQISSLNIEPLKKEYQSDYPRLSHNTGRLEIRLENLSFGYSPNKYIFNNYSKSIQNIRCLGIIGANGSGKSTLSFLMLELLKPNSGSIHIQIEHQSPAIGYLDQFPERMLGANSLSIFTQELIDESVLKSGALQKIIQDLDEWNIHWENCKDKPAMDIPWSMLRIAMVVILANSDFELLILDEPTFGLGWKQKVNLHRYLNMIFLKKYGIILSHDIEFIHSVCDDILALD